MSAPEGSDHPENPGRLVRQQLYPLLTESQYVEHCPDRVSLESKFLGKVAPLKDKKARAADVIVIEVLF